MEVPRGNDRKALVATYELFGTAIFLYMILVSTGDQFAVPLALYASILIFGGITGGHFNPFNVNATLGPAPGEGADDEYEVGFGFSN